MIALIIFLVALVVVGLLSNRPGLNFYARSLGADGRLR